MTRPGELHLFDLDGVLTRSDTTAALVLRRVREQPMLFVSVVLLALASLACPVQGRLRPRLHRAIVATAFARMDRSGYERIARAEAVRLAERAGFRNRDAEAAVRDALAEGEAVVLTAAEGHLARCYLGAVGLGGVRVIASTVRFGRDGMRFVDHVVGPRKLERARLAGLDLAGASFVTDSLTDMPLAGAVHRCLLVNPTRRRAAVVARAVPHVQVVRWR